MALCCELFFYVIIFIYYLLQKKLLGGCAHKIKNAHESAFHAYSGHKPRYNGRAGNSIHRKILAEWGWIYSAVCVARGLTVVKQKARMGGPASNQGVQTFRHGK